MATLITTATYYHRGTHLLQIIIEVKLQVILFLLLDTYEKGKQEVLDERGKDLSEEGEDEDEGEDENVKDKDQDSEDKPLLPPEVFKHLKTAATGEKKEEKPVIGSCDVQLTFF